MKNIPIKVLYYEYVVEVIGNYEKKRKRYGCALCTIILLIQQVKSENNENGEN